MPGRGQCWALEDTDKKSIFINMDFRIILQNNSNHLLNTQCAFHTLPLVHAWTTFDGFLHYFPSFPDEGIK